MSLYHHRAKCSRGFTLLELLVVIVIVAVLAGVTSLSIHSGTEKKLAEEASRLSALIDLAMQKAILDTRELVFQIDGDSYVFLAQLEDDEGKVEWVPFDESGPLRPRTLPEGVHLNLSVEGFDQEASEDGKQEDTPPQIWLFSSGEISPFTMDISLEDGPTYTLEGDLVGNLSLIKPEQAL